MERSGVSDRDGGGITIFYLCPSASTALYNTK
jgi:hypothetical protein